MAVIESIKDAVGLGHGSSGTTEHAHFHCDIPTSDRILTDSVLLLDAVPASREAMSEAKLPLAYRDSCAGLLIPLNKCRHDTFFAIWKCEVSAQEADFQRRDRRQKSLWNDSADRTSIIE